MIESGKIPPQARDMERAVLGAVLMEQEAIGKAINLLHDECFYVPSHQLIWKAITELYHSNLPIDALTICEQLKKNGNLESAGGVLFIAELTNHIGSAANIETHAYVVKECYLKRKFISMCSHGLSAMYEDTTDFFDGFDKLLSDAEGINRELNRIQQTNFADVVAERISELKDAGETKTYKTGVTSQLDALDKQTMGFQPSDLIIVAGRPAMGKTAFAIDLMRHQASKNIPIGFFSLEMATKQIVDRMFASESEVPLKQIRRGGMNHYDWNKIDKATSKLSSYPIYICDNGGLSINDIVSISKQWKIKFGIQIIYLDYLQLCSGTFKKNGNREQEISEISRRLKQLAKELHVPVVALSQLSRACESRADKRPMLSDLRESGAIEQDADMVIFPWREEYYNPMAEKGVCELIIDKYRNGSTGKVFCHFNPETQKFSNADVSPFN